MRPERCWPLAVGVFRGTACLVVGVSVGRNYRSVVVWRSADGQAWPVVCPQLSTVRCGAPAGRRLIAKPRPRLPIATAAPW